jgi:hypothetical protein
MLRIERAKYPSLAFLGYLAIDRDTSTGRHLSSDMDPRRITCHPSRAPQPKPILQTHLDVWNGPDQVKEVISRYLG